MVKRNTHISGNLDQDLVYIDTQIAATQMSCQFYKLDTMISTFITAQS